MVWEREAILDALTRKGFELRNDRDHMVLTFGGLTRSIYTKLSRGSGYKVYGDKLLGDVSRQLMLTRKQLDSLIECTMGQDEYVAALKVRGIGIRIAPQKPGS
jgi:hypothetical protein